MNNSNSSTTKESLTNDQLAEETLLRLRDFMNSVKNGSKMGRLQTAISSLQSALEKGTHDATSRAVVQCHLIKALLTRYGLHGWIEDLDECVALLKGAETIICFGKPQTNEGRVELRAADRLIQECRNSLNIDVLNAIIYIAGGRVGPHTKGAIAMSRKYAELLMLLGNALVMKYLALGDARDLYRATASLEDAERMSAGHVPHIHLCLASLMHVEWLRIMECGEEKMDGLIRLYQHIEKENLIDREGMDLLFQGGKMKALVEESYDDVQMQRVIALLTTSSIHRSWPHPRRGRSLNDLTHALYIRFERHGGDQDLEKCIEFGREALALRPVSHPERDSALNNLASALFACFQKKGIIEDLEKCIKLQREALDLRPTPHPLRFFSLSNLASALAVHYEHKGAHQDLEECILLYREVLCLRRAPHPDRVDLLKNLGIALKSRFDTKGVLEDLEEFIMLQREALELLPNSHLSRPIYENNLACALLIRFMHKGIFQDLEECVVLYRDLTSTKDLSYEDRFTSLNNLASALSTRFQHKGVFQDLEECISLHRKALSEPGSDRSLSLNNLASALYTRFSEKEDRKDLEECITLHREALTLRSPPHPERFSSLNNLGNALSALFRVNGALEDLEESIELHREALVSYPASHPNRSTMLSNLAISLLSRFKQCGVSKDIEESILLHKEALNLLPDLHPNRAWSLSRLAGTFFERFHQRNKQLSSYSDNLSSFFRVAGELRTISVHDKNDVDLISAMTYYEEAAKCKTGSLLDRLLHSEKWATIAQMMCRPAASLDAYQYLIELLPQLASLDLTLQQRFDALRHTRDLMGDAAKCAIEATRYDLAVTFLSTGRSIFWSQALQLRTPVDELAVAHPDIAERFTAISRTLESASYHSRVSGSGSFEPTERISNNTYTSIHNLVKKQHQIIEEIRSIQGYEGFLRPPTFSLLQPAADNGPVIVLNACQLSCDALIVSKTAPVMHVPLPVIGSKEAEVLQRLINNMALGSTTRSMDISQDALDVLRKLLGRDMLPNVTETEDWREDIFRLVLACLWGAIVEPVVKALGIEKTDSPKRIWWCATGPFASLPIHAAGIYSEGPEPIDCLFQYAVSSYCTSLQDLQHSPPKMTQGYRMTAIFEPEAPGAAALPATRAELEAIEALVPNRHRLSIHTGTKDVPNQVHDLISDVRRSSFVHFGCHGMQDLNDPLESYLLLSGGRLTISKIIQEFQVPEGALAYLSACETAKGDKMRPDESLTLVSTMMFAGFRSVVGTMWSIIDNDTPIVADVFYRHLFRNGNETDPDVTDAAYGLHLATGKLREEGTPFHSWVPYVHYGI